MRKFLVKKVLPAVVAFSVPLLSFAEETGGSGSTLTMDTTATTEAATAIADGLTSILSSLSPIIAGVVLAGIAVWAIPRVVGIIKSAFGAGKGR